MQIVKSAKSHNSLEGVKGMDIVRKAEKRTDRTEKLRSRLLKTVPEISSERMRYYTKSYRDTEPQPPILRRAKALRLMLENMSLYILDGELIVGNISKYPRGVELFPEYEIGWIENELEGSPYHFDKRPADRFLIKDEVRVELKELLPYWRGKTFSERIRSVLPEDTGKTWEMGVIDSSWLLQGGDGHITVNFKKVVERGLNGIIEDIGTELEKLDLSEPEAINKKLFYDSALITLGAVITYAGRYSEYARVLAEDETNDGRRLELERISEVCSRVPANPAGSFQEALQSVVFVQFVEQIESNGHGVSLGRLDQTFYPCFLRDMDSGSITLEGAADLLQCFWLKLFSVNKIKDWNSTRFFAGYQAYQNLTVGGQLYGGVDAANELSFMMLGVQKAIKLWGPSVSFRYFDGTSEEFLQAAIEVIKQGGGQPALYSDECMIQSMLMRGVPYEDAVNWSVVGCVEPTIEGKQTNRPNGAAFVSILKMLELLMYGGKDPKTGYNLFPIDKDITSFSSFEEMMDNWEKLAAFYTKLQMAGDNIIDINREEMMPDPFASCLVDDCVKRGKTLKEGGAAYDYCGPLIVGLANVGDSFAAIKKLIFEEKKLTGDQLLHALDTNFEDTAAKPSGEEIRQMLIDAPKYGNDDDYVDSITAEVLDFFCREYPKYKTTRYGRGPECGMWLASCSTVSGNIPFGKQVGATPDGRKAGMPTADTTSPSQGMDRNGPLATIKSVGKIPNLLCTGGNLFNMKFSPLVLQDDASRLKFSSLIRTYLGDLKGMHMQFNIVDAGTLKDAKKRPEKYPDLLVRVAGFSALFTSLDPDLQEDIIARTELATV